MGNQDLAKWTESIIKDFIVNSTENSQFWAEPLVGFSNGADPLFETYKEHVGPFHMTPLEIFSKALPSISTEAKQLTVISWILPQTEEAKSDNRKETLYPSERWVRSRMSGEAVNNKLREHVVDFFESSGYAAVAPLLSPFWERKISDRYGLASNWSERHAAYASGLGTFGLSDGLITPKGQAMRCGSVIVQLELPATKRPYQHHQAYCLFFSEGKCDACIKRCPAGAISEIGHDKIKCRNYTRSIVRKNNSSIEGKGCGLCQTGVPCESMIPVLPHV